MQEFKKLSKMVNWAIDLIRSFKVNWKVELRKGNEFDIIQYGRVWYYTIYVSG